MIPPSHTPYAPHASAFHHCFKEITSFLTIAADGTKINLNAHCPEMVKLPPKASLKSFFCQPQNSPSKITKPEKSLMSFSSITPRKYASILLPCVHFFQLTLTLTRTPPLQNLPHSKATASTETNFSITNNIFLLFSSKEGGLFSALCAPPPRDAFLTRSCGVICATTIAIAIAAMSSTARTYNQIQISRRNARARETFTRGSTVGTERSRKSTLFEGFLHM